MQWWDDLWLNEAFATFMSFQCMADHPELQRYWSVWASFLDEIYWGINTDMRSSTHPICATISDTDEAESLFDGISYGKSSAFLKCIYKVVGFEVMKRGLHKYFDDF